MAGETNLKILLKSMKPNVIDGEFVFITFKDGQYGEHADLHPIAMFCENEGMTLVIPKASAEKEGLSFDSVFSCITLNVYSSLEAVGLTAAFSNKLADNGISANVIAGYYHDHIFVQIDTADKALKVLQEFAQ